MMKFKEIIEQYKKSGMNGSEMIEALAGFAPIFDAIKDKDKKLFQKGMRKFHEKAQGPHFDEMYAEAEVREMYHTKRNGSICKGEIFTEDEAERVYEREVRRSSSRATIWDVYVALNAQYHDYAKLFKEWFGENNDEKIKEKVIESAVCFWFKDEDAEPGKIWRYFYEED